MNLVKKLFALLAASFLLLPALALAQDDDGGSITATGYSGGTAGTVGLTRINEGDDGGGITVTGYSGGTLTNAGTVDLTGIDEGDDGGASLTVEGSGALTISASTGDGDTLDLGSDSDGVLQIGAGTFLGDGGTLSLGPTGDGGTLTLDGDNTFTGLTTISAGTLQISYNLNLDPIDPTNFTVINDGDLVLTIGDPLTLTSENLQVSAGSSVTGDVSTAQSGNIEVDGTIVGNVSVGAGSYIGGSGNVNGGITVGAGGSTYPGDPQILTANNVEYQNGSTAQFSVATTGSSSHPPTPGVDYDQMKLTGGPAQVLQIDSGTTTLQLNFSAASLAAVQANAQNNINDLYFVFNLGTGTSTGQFTDLTLTEGANTYTDAITGDTATFSQLGLQFDLSYTANETNDSLLGGNDVAFSVSPTPEPGTWELLLMGLGLLIVFQRRKKLI